MSTEQLKTYTIPNPLDEIFLYQHKNTYEVEHEGVTTYELDRIDYTDGINTYIKGIPFARKGFPTPQAVWENNILKRLLMIAIKLPLFLVRPKKQRELLAEFTTLGYKVMRHNFLKLHYLTPTTQELHVLIKFVLQSIGIKKDEAYRGAVVFSHLLEYDNAYRYRLQDIMSETTKKKLLNTPIKELRRLMKLMAQRDHGTHLKFKRIVFFLSLALLIPKYRAIWKNMIKYLNIEKLQFDQADRYWVSVRNDYDFFGKSFEERYESLKVKPVGLQIKHD